MRFAVDPWDPDYGSSVGGDSPESESEVRIDVECAADRWSAIVLASDDGDRPPVVFVDGVRRIDARTWITADDGTSEPGIFASYGAGALCCEPGRAELAAIEIGHVLSSPSPALQSVELPCGTWRAVSARDATIESLTYAVHQAMTKAEVRVAEQARRRRGDELIVVDGPLRDRAHVPDAIGLVKTHHVRYLVGDAAAVVDGLRAGERTPVFLVASTWSRYSWYVRLPGAPGGPWAGVVRCEASVELSPAEVVAVAQRVSGLLLRYASTPHKDARAPQNLFPIGGLERTLRRRLGDAAFVYRALRVGAAQLATSAAR